MAFFSQGAPAATDDVIQGERYKLAGISVHQKGTLVQVFAKFARINDTLADITALPARPAPKEGDAPDFLQPLPRGMMMPSLSVDDIAAAIAGRKDLNHGPADCCGESLMDTDGVIKDLGPAKLAQVLVKMGEVRKHVLEQGNMTFVPVLKHTPKPPKA